MTETSQKMEVVVNGGKAVVNVRKWSVASPKGVAICFHGLSVSSAEFVLLAEELNKNQFDVICPDWIGHGQSSYLGNGDAYRWDNYASCLSKVIHAFGQPGRTHLLGCSYGGIVLLLFLLASKFKPASATFVDVPVVARRELIDFNQVIAEVVSQEFPDLEAATNYLHHKRPSLGEFPGHLAEFLTRNRFVKTGAAYRIACDPMVSKGAEVEVNANFDFRPRLSGLHFDCLFLYGCRSPFRERDWFLELTKSNGQIRFSDALNAGHPPSLLTYEQVKPIAQFMAENTSE